MHKKVFLVLFSIFLSVYILELFCSRLLPYDLSLRKILKISDNPRLLWELKPNTEITFTGLHVKLPPTIIKISSQGLRDYEYSIKKPNETLRIIILGDSIGFGWGVEMEQTVAKQCELLLNKDNRNKYEVINFSSDAYNTAQEIALLKSKGIFYQPDLVIFIVCSNDYIPTFNYFYPFKFLKYMPEIFYESHLLRAILVGYLLKNEAKLKQQSEKGLIRVDRAFDVLESIIKKHNLQVLFYLVPEWMKGILEKHNLARCIIPHNFNLGAYAINKIDGHPNPIGHRKMAEEIYSFLREHGF